MTKINLYGEQTCDYFLVTYDSSVPPSNYQNINLKPSWDEFTSFLVNFNHNLTGGNSSIGADFVGWILYRKNLTKNTPLEFVATITNNNINNIRDYMVTNGEEYNYHLVANTNEYMASPFISDKISTCFEDYYLLLGEEKGEVVQVTDIYKFALNLSTSDLTNNAMVNKMINFTPYPKVQVANANFMSGTLTSFTGYVGEDNKYADSKSVIEDLRNLNINPKRKFLKDRKGFIREIGIDAPISFGVIDETVEQIYSVTIPWCEIGSIDNVSLIGINDSYEWILTDTGIPKLGTSYLIQPNNHINPDTYLTGKKIF